MKIILFGSSCELCRELAYKIEHVIMSKNLPTEFEKSNDIKYMLSYGIQSTPSIVINEQIASISKDLTYEEIETLIHHYININKY